MSAPVACNLLRMLTPSAPRQERELAGDAAARQPTVDLLDGKPGLIELDDTAGILDRQTRRERNVRRFHHDPPADLAKQSPLERLSRPSRGSTWRRAASRGRHHDRQIDLSELDLTARGQGCRADLQSTTNRRARSPAENVAEVDGAAA